MARFSCGRAVLQQAPSDASCVPSFCRRPCDAQLREQRDRSYSWRGRLFGGHILWQRFGKSSSSTFLPHTNVGTFTVARSCAFRHSHNSGARVLRSDCRARPLDLYARIQQHPKSPCQHHLALPAHVPQHSCPSPPRPVPPAPPNPPSSHTPPPSVIPPSAPYCAYSSPSFWSPLSNWTGPSRAWPSPSAPAKPLSGLKRLLELARSLYCSSAFPYISESSRFGR